MLWTVPVLSFLTCIVVFLYSIFAEGITPTIRLEGITLLDEGSRQATTLGYAAYYCPLTPGEGLHFGYDTEVTPLVDIRGYGSGSQRQMDWTRDQHLTAGWVSARVPAHFMVRKSELRRERLRIAKKEGKLTAMNGLGETIRSLWLADRSGKVYRAENIGAGEQVHLIPVGRSSAAPATLLQQMYQSKKWTLATTAVAKKPITMLWPNTYVAVLDGVPFMDRGLKGRSKTKLQSLVIGMMAEGEADDV